MARYAADAYRRMVRYYRESGHDAAQADALAREPNAQVREMPSHEVTWIALNGLLEADPDAAQAVWQRVKADAGAFVASGSNVAEALGYTDPWQRAQFVALRAAVHQDWQPSGAVEAMVADTYVAATVSYLYWLGRLHERDLAPVPEHHTAEALDQAAQMADRFHRQAVRALRAMRDLRRYSVVINGGVGQLNVGQQQVNVKEQR